jgi:predicted exporter
MKRLGAWLWLAVLVLALGYLALRLSAGISLQSNILALLPPTERDVTAQGIQDRIANVFSRRIVFLVGDTDPAKARAVALELSTALAHSGLISALASNLDSRAEQRMAAAYFPYRTGLLSDSDRDHLLANNGQALVSRALSMLYGPEGFANARLIENDPFLLLPAYFLALPLPQSRLAADNGVLSVRDGNETYVLVSADIAGDAYALKFQTRFGDFLSKTLDALRAQAPGLKVLRTGAVFYAREGAKEAMNETSIIGFVSTAATLALILLVFHDLRPILLGFLAIGAGILCAFIGTLLVFGQIHTIALLFGVSLIAISVDYSLQYFCEYFDPGAPDAAARLKRVLPGVAIGITTTLIGYCTLLLAPFPGLQQVAVFSLVGLGASCLTVVLWYPLLDANRPPRADNRFVRFAARHWALWEDPGLRSTRIAIVVLCAALAAAGLFRLRTDDDVRHLQPLDADLKQQQVEVERLTGSSPGTQFLLVRGANEQALLETEERLASHLLDARGPSVLGGFTAMSQFVPSFARQSQNRKLVLERLTAPYLARYLAQIGYQGGIDYAGPNGLLAPADLPRTGPLSLLSVLDASNGTYPAHIVLLQNVMDAGRLVKVIAGIPGTRFVSLTDDWSRLFGNYRRYALDLLVLSALLMYPLLGWRYGWGGGLRVMAPSLLAVALAPPIAALAGVAFTFFNAMALVLVLSIGVDYSVFCRETSGARKPVTMLAIALAALSTILSFGMLAFSRVFAVHAFGATMLIGIALAFLFAPIAGDGDSSTRKAAST